jgi:hypothetical protein
MHMSLFKPKQRKHPRISYIDTVEFEVTLNSADDAKSSIGRGITMDICNNGACIYTSTSLKQGQQVDIVKGTPPHICTTATVRWVKKLDVELYKVGLMLM